MLYDLVPFEPGVYLAYITWMPGSAIVEVARIILIIITHLFEGPNDL